MFEGAICHSLDDNHVFWQGQIPDTLDVDDAQFEALWALHPETFHEMQGNTLFSRVEKHEKDAKLADSNLATR